jgi:hypothetical protein
MIEILKQILSIIDNPNPSPAQPPNTSRIHPRAPKSQNRQQLGFELPKPLIILIKENP